MTGPEPVATTAGSRRPGRRLVPIAAVLVVVAGLSIWWLWPSSGGESAQRMTAGPYQVTLRVGDGSPRTGDNTVDLDITTGQGDPATPQRVSVDPAMPQMGHAVPPIAATVVTPGHYRATVNLPMPGQWEVAVQLAGPQGSGTATFSVQAN